MDGYYIIIAYITIIFACENSCDTDSFLFSLSFSRSLFCLHKLKKQLDNRVNRVLTQLPWRLETCFTVPLCQMLLYLHQRIFHKKLCGISVKVPNV